MQNHPIPNAVRSISTSTTTPNASRRNSSLQKVWAEDYYYAADAGAPGNTFEHTGHISPPPPATLTTRPFPRSIPLSSDEEACPARNTRQLQRSLTALLPFRPRTNSQSPQRSPPASPHRSPVKERLDSEFMPTLTGDKDGAIRVEDKSKGGLSGWFSGSSAPVPVGIPTTEETSTTSQDPSTERQAAKLQPKPTLSRLNSASSINAPKTSAPGSRFGFFNSKTSSAKTVQIPAAMDDEFLSLDINSALFPSGSPSDRDPFSPSSFRNLLINAEGLLLKLQTAYKVRTLSLHEITAEKEAQSEELEEAELRAKHLKLQLEDMGRKLQSQDAVIAELATELAYEKKARAEEKAAREKSIALVKFNREEAGTPAGNQIPIHEEDLGISRAGQKKNQWRQSNTSTDTSVGGESDIDDESVFSRSRSPTFVDSSTTSIMTSASTPEIAQASFGRVIPSQALPPINRPKQVQQASTFQKILKGISGDTTPAPAKGGFGGLGLGEGCSNCRGKDSTVAWDTVGLLKVENKELKDRVGELEGAVEGALDMCEGIWLQKV